MHPTFSRRALIQRLLGAGAVISMPGLVAACGGDDTTTTTSGGAPGTTPGGATAATTAPAAATTAPAAEALRVTAALPGSISTLDVTREAGILNYIVALLCQEALVGVDADGALVPALASEWAQPDEVTYVFTLRDGVTFSDGTPLTVDDVLASIEVNRAEGSTSALAYAYGGIASAEQTGDNEVTVVLTEPNAAFGWTLSPGLFQITSKAFLEANGDQVGTPGVLLLGTGPYVITEFAPDSHVSLVANPDWWGGTVEVQELRIDFIPQESTRQLAMREGNVDVAASVGLDQIGQWEQIDGVEVQTTTDNSLVTLAFSTTTPPFDELAVRTAVAHCVDREAIVSSLLEGQGIVATTIPTPEQWGGVLTADEVEHLYSTIPTVPFDIEAAKQQLAASSVPDGFSMTIMYPNSGPHIGTALLSLAQNLKEIGVTLDVQEVTLEQWIANLVAHGSPVILGWYFATTGDPAEYAHILLNSAFVGEGGTNLAEYDNPEVTDLLDRAQRSIEPAERGQLLGEALVKSAADVPYFPLWWGAAATAFGPRVTTSAYGPYFFIGPWATQLTPKG